MEHNMKTCKKCACKLARKQELRRRKLEAAIRYSEISMMMEQRAEQGLLDL